MRFAWTDDIFARAKRLFLEGRSATEVAVAIGCPSRNAVIGKLARGGVVRGTAAFAATNASTNRQAVRQKPAPPPRVVKLQPSRTPPPPVRAAPAPESVVTPFRPHASTTPGAERTLMHLDGARCCRWPISPPHVPGADMLFCGAAREEGSPYCPGHRELSGATQRSEAQRAADSARAERMRLTWKLGAQRRAG